MTTFNPLNRGNFVGNSNPPLGQLQLNALRAVNIAAYLQGPAVIAPLWVTLTPYVAGNVVTITGGQHLVCGVGGGGTSGASMPVYTAAVLTGRPLVDGSVTWYGLPFIKSANDVNAPTITSGANAAAVGLTETKFVSGTSTVLSQALAGSFGAVPVNHLSGTYLGRYTFANAPLAGSGNATTAAVTDGGQNANFQYQCNSCELELYVTDSKFGIVISSSTNPTVIEIDGQLVSGNPLPATGVGWCVAFDYAGVVKRRRVRLSNNSNIDNVRGVALSTIGFIELTDSPSTDTMLLLGDSINNTVVPAATAGNGLAGPMGGWIAKLLGMTAVINCGIGGSGYSIAGANSFTVQQMLLATPNLSILPAYAPSHILCSAGFNDRNTSFSIVGPAALSTWITIRTVFPNAKITITDGFSEAGGPDAAALSQAISLAALFNQWNDGNSQFVKSTGTATSAWMQGTNNAGGALQAGNTCNFVGTDGTHPTPAGAYYLAQRMAAAIKTAWNNQY